MNFDLLRQKGCCWHSAPPFEGPAQGFCSTLPKQSESFAAAVDSELRRARLKTHIKARVLSEWQSKRKQEDMASGGDNVAGSSGDSLQNLMAAFNRRAADLKEMILLRHCELQLPSCLITFIVSVKLELLQGGC